MIKYSNNKKNRLNAIATNIPIINVFSALSVELIPLPGFHLGEVRVLIFLVIIFLVLKKFRFNENVTKWIIYFLVYLFFLVLFSSNFYYSFFGTYLKVVVTMLMFPVGYYLINTEEKIIKFIRSFIMAGFILSINYLIAQIYGIGRSVYLDDSFYHGYAGIGSTVVLTYLIITAPLSHHTIKSGFDRLMVWFVVISSLIFTIVALKRIAIIALGVGLIVYLLKSGRFKKNLKMSLAIFLVLIITTPLYLDVFEARFEARTTVRNELTQEGRYFDIINAIYDFQNTGIKHALFGTELFNTPGYYGRDRQVHVDYANLLIGSGIIGLLFYLFIHIAIFKKFIRSFSKLNNKFSHLKKDEILFLKEVNGVFYAILFASLVVSFSGGLHVITTRSMVFVTLGSLYGLIKNKNFILQQDILKTKNKNG